MAKVTFDNVPDDAASYVTSLVNDYLRAKVEAEALAILRAAPQAVKDQVLAIAAAEKVKQDATKAKAEADAAAAAEAEEV